VLASLLDREDRRDAAIARLEQFDPSFEPMRRDVIGQLLRQSDGVGAADGLA
jgi:hypothetical protein